MEEVPPLLRKSNPVAAPASWLTIAALVDKGQAKQKSNGGYFSVWKFSDLRKGGLATTLSVLLFDEAFSESWKETPGTVFAILNPRIMPARDGDDVCTLCVEKKPQLQRIGQACEFGLCKGERKSDGKPCGMWVNACEGGGYCEYHAAQALKKLEAQQRAAAAAAANPFPQRTTGAKQATLPHGVTYMNGAALPSGWMPPNSGVPKGMDSANMPRPSWSASNQTGIVKTQAERIQDAVNLLRSAGYTVTPPAHLTNIPEPDPNSMQPFGAPSTVMAPAHLRAARAASPPLLGNELLNSGYACSSGNNAAARNSSGAPSSSRTTSSAPFPKPSAGPSIPKPSSSTSTTAKPSHTESAFERQFGGRLSADSKEGQKLMSARTQHADAEREKGRERLGAKLDVLAKKEALKEKDQQLTCIEVSAHRCEICKYTAERQGKECKELGHSTKVIQKMKKRGFACGKCKHHTTELNARWPKSACTKCGADDWKDAGIRKAASDAPTAASEFKPRGEEHGKFRNSAPQRAGLQVAESDGNSQRQQQPAANPNAFAKSLPELE